MMNRYLSATLGALLFLSVTIAPLAVRSDDSPLNDCEDLALHGNALAAYGACLDLGNRLAREGGEAGSVPTSTVAAIAVTRLRAYYAAGFAGERMHDGRASKIAFTYAKFVVAAILSYDDTHQSIRDAKGIARTMLPTITSKLKAATTLAAQQAAEERRGQKMYATPTPEIAHCALPNRDASIEHTVETVYPDSARDLGLGPVTVLVNVEVLPNGSISNASIYKSSGNGAVDREALRVAWATTYVGAIKNCKPVSGEYLLRAEFNPD